MDQVKTLEDDQRSVFCFVFCLFSQKRRAKSLTTVLVVLEDFGDVAGVDEAKELLERRQWERHSAEAWGTVDPHEGGKKKKKPK